MEVIYLLAAVVSSWVSWPGAVLSVASQSGPGCEQQRN